MILRSLMLQEYRKRGIDVIQSGKFDEDEHYYLDTVFSISRHALSFSETEFSGLLRVVSHRKSTASIRT